MYISIIIRDFKLDAKLPLRLDNRQSLMLLLAKSPSWHFPLKVLRFLRIHTKKIFMISFVEFSSILVKILDIPIGILM